MKKNTVFSDLHFNEDNYRAKLKSKEAIWIRKVSSISGEVTLAGDIFDVSLGSAASEPIRQHILKNLFADKVINYIGGNHDYYMVERNNITYPHVIIDDTLICHGHFFDIWHWIAHHLKKWLGIRDDSLSMMMGLSHPYLSLCSTDIVDSPALSEVSEKIQDNLSDKSLKSKFLAGIKVTMKLAGWSWFKRKICMAALRYVIKEGQNSAKRSVKFNKEYFSEYINALGKPVSNVIYGHTHKRGVSFIVVDGKTYNLYNTGSWDSMAACHIIGGTIIYDEYKGSI